jgi:hypothetical protein
VTRASTNFVHTGIDHYPECTCDGTCPKCAEEMASELLSVLAVLNLCQYDKDPYQLELKKGGVAELVAKAIWGEP